MSFDNLISSLVQDSVLKVGKWTCQIAVTDQSHIGYQIDDVYQDLIVVLLSMPFIV